MLFLIDIYMKSLKNFSSSSNLISLTYLTDKKEIRKVVLDKNAEILLSLLISELRNFLLLPWKSKNLVKGNNNPKVGSIIFLLFIQICELPTNIVSYEERTFSKFKLLKVKFIKKNTYFFHVKKCIYSEKNCLAS